MKRSVAPARVAGFGVIEALLIVGFLGLMVWVGVVLTQASAEQIQADALVEAFVDTRKDLAMGERPELLQERLAQRVDPLFENTTWSVQSDGREDWVVGLEMPPNEQVCFRVVIQLNSLFHQKNVKINGEMADLKSMDQACLNHESVKIELQSERNVV